MTDIKPGLKAHPSETELADLLGGSLSSTDKERLENHVASCDECLEKVVSAHEAVSCFKAGHAGKKGVASLMKKINIYIVLAVISFALSFVMPRYFLQFLVATLILGTKWIIDSRTTKMLIMIHEAWKKGGEKEASKILETMDTASKSRF
jgi:hypothetical protein